MCDDKEAAVWDTSGLVKFLKEISKIRKLFITKFANQISFSIKGRIIESDMDSIF